MGDEAKIDATGVATKKGGRKVGAAEIRGSAPRAGPKQGGGTEFQRGANCPFLFYSKHRL